MTGLRAVPTSVNRQPAVAYYLWREQEDAYLPLTLDVLRIGGGVVTEITTFHADQFPRLGLPERLPADGAGMRAGGIAAPWARGRDGLATLAAMAATGLSPRSPGPQASTSRSTAARRSRCPASHRGRRLLGGRRRDRRWPSSAGAPARPTGSCGSPGR